MVRRTARARMAGGPRHRQTQGRLARRPDRDEEGRGAAEGPRGGRGAGGDPAVAARAELSYSSTLDVTTSPGRGGGRAGPVARRRPRVRPGGRGAADDADRRRAPGRREPDDAVPAVP